jgi:hypothetical protein
VIVTDQDLEPADLLKLSTDLIVTLIVFRRWLDEQEAGHATHVPIAEIRRVFGWTGEGTT